MLHKFLSKLFRVVKSKFSNLLHQQQNANQNTQTLKQQVLFQSSVDQSSFKDALAAAHQYFSQFEENREAFFRAMATEEFHQAFTTILKSMSDETRQQLYKKAAIENKRFEESLAEGNDIVAALAAYMFEDMPQLQYFYTSSS